MTQKGKCDICRPRKVKCDERRPQCGQCGKRDRPCSYKTADAARDARDIGGRPIGDIVKQKSPVDELGLQSTWQAPHQSGLYQTMFVRKMQREPPIRSLSSAESRLTLRWMHTLVVLGKDYHFDILGSISLQTPEGLGRSQLVDDAVEYFLDTHLLYKRSDLPDDPINARRALVSGARAMGSLQNALKDEQNGTSDQVLMSIKLLILAEIFRKSQSMTYCIHQIAFCRVLMMRLEKGENKEIDKYLALAAFFEEFMIAVWTGCPSAFENIPKAHLPQPRPHQQLFDETSVAAYIMKRVVVIPRLLSLLRSYSATPTVDVAMHVLELTKSIDDVGATYLIEDYLDRSTSFVDTKPENEPALVPKSFNFEHLGTFMLTVFYYTYRITIYGIIKRLLDLKIATPTDFDYATAEAHDVQAAEAIAMCTQYAFERDYEPPLLTLRLGGPTSLAYGSWDRLETRLETRKCSGDDETRRLKMRAPQMKQYQVRVSRRIGSLWGWGALTEDYLRNACDAFSGGEFTSPLGQQTGYVQMSSLEHKIRDLTLSGWNVGDIEVDGPPIRPMSKGALSFLRLTGGRRG